MKEGQQAPVNEGQEYDVEVESVGEKGDGIAKVKGFVLFVGGTQKGDLVKVKVTKVLQNVGFAQVVKKLDKLDRPEPKPRKRFATVNPDEMEDEEPEVDSNYEDTDDFGSDLDEE